MPRSRLWLLACGLLLANGLGNVVVVEAAKPESTAPVNSADALRLFEEEVRPLLVENCFKCHGPEKQQANLRLDSRESILAGGDSGPAIVPGKPDESLLIAAVSHDALEMPPTGKLGDREVTALARWVSLGAPWPEQSSPSPPREQITDLDRSHWSFQPIARPLVPQVQDDGWARTEIDAFVYRRLEEQGLQPSPEADRRTLIRRVYFDLVGLPPSPEEVEAFVADPSPRAYEELVDRLLTSPHYGEKWARHWLDLVRYAESDGFKQDAYRPNAWLYRDYVVRSLNRDKPYDQFVREQLAGDEIAPHEPDALIATGFLRHWIYEYNQRDVRTQWENILTDVTNVTGEVFLGLGVGCARCHNHKFDPILREDYYRLRAFFTPLLPRDDLPLASSEELAAYHAQLARWEEATAEIRQQLEELERPLLEKAARRAIDKFPPDIRPMMRRALQERAPLEAQLADLAFRQAREEQKNVDFAKELQGEAKERWQQLREQLAALEPLKPAPLPTVLAVTDVGAEAPPTILPGKEQPIEPGFPLVLDPQPPRIEPPLYASQSTGRRTALADWITRPDNPLTARVMVNRIWQYHFGRGLVATSSDFGRLGEPPTHPELLDWLASYFVDQGWSLKEVHRLIVTSAVYRQASRSEASEQAVLRDPDARLLWRMPTRRLDAEQIRDAMLAVSGELDRTMGGPSVETDKPRRTIYTKVLRNDRDPLQEVFDAPDGFTSTSQRNTTTTANQALYLMNGSWTLDRARRMAQLLEGLETAALIERAYQLAYGRAPRTDELQTCLAFFPSEDPAEDANVSASQDERRRAAVVDLCHVLLNSNEFLYLD